MHYYWLSLALGAMAFPHCLGMCGGFALHLAGGQSRLAALGRQLFWHAGKMTTYAFLGALAALAGRAAWGGGEAWQSVFSYVLGAVMAIMGLSMLGVLPHRSKKDASAGPGIMAGVFGQFFAKPSAGGALALGIATGFLPCPIVIGGLAIAADAAREGGAVAGIVSMLCLGAGTAWSLVVLAMVGQFVSVKLRRRAVVSAGCVLILLGVATALRGNEAFHRFLGGGQCEHCAAGGGEAATTTGPSAPSAPASGSAGHCCEP